MGDVGPGTLLECIREIGSYQPYDVLPVVGRIYTVRRIAYSDNSDGEIVAGVWLEEIRNVPRPCTSGWVEPGFVLSAFRPLDSDRLATFREAVDDVFNRDRVTA